MYKINENYFENIDNKNKAYWLGFIAADGNVYGNKLSIELNSKDEGHLKNFLEDLESPRPLRYRERNGYKYVILEIRNSKLVEDLKKYEIIPNKTNNLNFPLKLDKKYYKDYIRGFFDGDGTYVFCSKYAYRKERKKYYNRISCEISCVCKSKKFIDKISEILNLNNVDNKIYYCKRDKLYYLRMTGIKKSKKFINYIYYDDCLMLSRKKEKMLEIEKYRLA